MTVPAALPSEMLYLQNLSYFAENSKKVNKYFNHKILCELEHKSQSLPLHAVKFGRHSEGLPTLFLIGGVHGVERIGAQVVLSFLDNFIQRSMWDESVKDLSQRINIWFIPVVNPWGLKHGTRANANSVDLMRNSPIDAQQRTTFMVGGQRITRLLPWHRGIAGQMETEAQVITDLVLEEAQKSPFTMLLDVHSGFGVRDRLWFPLASSNKPITHLPEFYALNELLMLNYPNHDYIFEPQSQHYLTHGDLWDYCYLELEKSNKLIMPLTLEMGSWRWVKKNPLQFSRFGVFNPVKLHRMQRVLRRHLILMEFLIRTSVSWKNWMPSDNQRPQTRRKALNEWYEQQVS